MYKIHCFTYHYAKWRSNAYLPNRKNCMLAWAAVQGKVMHVDTIFGKRKMLA